MTMTDVFKKEAMEHKEWKLAAIKQLDEKYNMCIILKTDKYGRIAIDVQLRAFDDVIMGTFITPNRATSEISLLSVKQAIESAVQRYKEIKDLEEKCERFAA